MSAIRSGAGHSGRDPRPAQDGAHLANLCDFILPVLKEPGCTSHDVVVLLRRALGVRRVGHTGTLDPFATGLLLCCVGRATKLSNYLMDLDKTYEGDLRLGVRTRTGDRMGETVARAPVGEMTLEELQRAARTFIGEYLQVPPMVSALKHKGRRLYELARRGVEVERMARKVAVREFRILGRSGDLVRFRVRCGRGMYVRTLVEDFGRRLKTEATVEQLARTAVGGFTGEMAVEQAQVRAGDLEAIRRKAVPMARALEHLRPLTLTAAWVRHVRRGVAPSFSVVDAGGSPPEAGQIVRLLGPEGSLVALATVESVPGKADRHWADSRILRLERVL